MSITRRDFVVSSATAAAVAAALPSSRAHAATGSGDPDVIVIGAGLSGLETALTLEENGLKVLVLEGRKRIGGRVFTLFDVPGHPEVGGNTIANAYGRCIAAGAKYGVEIVNLAPRLFANRAGQELYLGGQHIPLKDWATHPKNPFAAEQKKLPPWGWADAMFKQHMPFKDLENWYDPKYAQYDVSVHDFLVSKGATDAMIRLGFDSNIAYGTTSHDVSLLQQAFADYWQNVNRGAIMGFSRTGASGANAAPPPARRARRLPAHRRPAQRLRSRRTRWRTSWWAPTRAATRTCRSRWPSASRATCCRASAWSRSRAATQAPRSPAPTARSTRPRPWSARCRSRRCATSRSTRCPGPTQYKAIQTLGYIPITQFHLVAKKPFWESDGLSPSMWTDGLLGMVLANRTGKTDTEVASLAVWCRGLAAQYIDRFGLQEGGRMIVAELERLRPAAKGLLTVGGAHSWAADPFSAGDWAIFQPGQVTALRQSIAQPHKRLFFCGEHTSVGSRGMEGAFESAERASLEVLGALG